MHYVAHETAFTKEWWDSKEWWITVHCNAVRPCVWIHAWCPPARAPPHFGAGEDAASSSSSSDSAGVISTSDTASTPSNDISSTPSNDSSSGNIAWRRRSSGGE